MSFVRKQTWNTPKAVLHQPILVHSLATLLVMLFKISLSIAVLLDPCDIWYLPYLNYPSLSINLVNICTVPQLYIGWHVNVYWATSMSTNILDYSLDLPFSINCIDILILIGLHVLMIIGLWDTIFFMMRMLCLGLQENKSCILLKYGIWVHSTS